MRASGLLLGLGLLGMWLFAIAVYPELPARIPVHFDGGGAPDRFVARTPGNWFLLPAILTVLVVPLGYWLPRWTRRMAARGSRWLNVPDRARFLALPPDARLRAIRPVEVLLRVIALEVTGLGMFLVHGTQQVAHGTWRGLPTLWLWLWIGGLVATALLGWCWCWHWTRRVADAPRPA